MHNAKKLKAVRGATSQYISSFKSPMDVCRVTDMATTAKMCVQRHNKNWRSGNPCLMSIDTRSDILLSPIILGTMAPPPSDGRKTKRSLKFLDKEKSRKRPRSEDFLSGKQFSVSALLDNDKKSEECDKSSSRDELSYNELVDICTKWGASCTSQVHKKVACVVATPNAIAQRTQRVRKGWRKNIPVVKVAWLLACIEERALIPYDDYRVEIPSDAACRLKEKGNEKPSIKPSFIEERKLDLGCCCLCHETGETAKCKWCVNCR